MRTACNTFSKLTVAGYLKSVSQKAPVRLAFPFDYRERLFSSFFGDGDLRPVMRSRAELAMRYPLLVGDCEGFRGMFIETGELQVL